ncbi:succinate dehydrogenase assembly factor 2 [Candidatus Parabeggiatoa sp. HSG14]|uniref:FAD assembly factor SdhE n=1 Tax=Candidatus Parabeggiatoa sp. HSG14 TaxID=3055593 RepID=UPI0025A6E46A|nr:succinate dehydrogenase assembly factor 2 [Thiotrichales bacterium HSG14]
MSELAKLKWRCRRGMKEMDILLTRYLEQAYEQASKVEQQAFQALLDMPDIDLYSYLIGQEKPTNRDTLALLEKIRQ